MPAQQSEEMTQLGLYGVIPFIAAAVALWLSPVVLPQHIALDFHQFALVYGGVIVIYLSGVGAGAGLNANYAHNFLPGILVALAALFVMLPSGTFFLSVGAVWRHLIILLLMIYVLFRDLNNVSAGLLPAWYGNLRMRQTLWIGLSIALIMTRLYVWGFY